MFANRMGAWSNVVFSLNIPRVKKSFCLVVYRVSNRKSGSMQIQSASMFFSRSTLGKIETTLQIAETLEKFALTQY